MVADTLLLYILTILSLRRVSVLSLTSFRSWSRSCAKSFEGGCVGSGTSPENVSLPDPTSFLFTSMRIVTGTLLTVSRGPAETCCPSSSESSTQSRLATEQGEVKERCDLFSLSLSEELRFWWCCWNDSEKWTTRYTVYRQTRTRLQQVNFTKGVHSDEGEVWRLLKKTQSKDIDTMIHYLNKQTPYLAILLYINIVKLWL